MNGSTPLGADDASGRDVYRVEPAAEARAAMYSMPNYDEYAYPVFGAGTGEAIRLDDADFGPK
jgi:hypothetical protein